MHQFCILFFPMQFLVITMNYYKHIGAPDILSYLLQESSDIKITLFNLCGSNCLAFLWSSRRTRHTVDFCNVRPLSQSLCNKDVFPILWKPTNIRFIELYTVDLLGDEKSRATNCKRYVIDLKEVNKDI